MINCRNVTARNDYGKGFDPEMYKKPTDLLNDLLIDKSKLDTASKNLLQKKPDDLDEHILLVNNERFIDSANHLLKRRRIVFDTVDNGDIEYLNYKF